jgi:hypothetical protein
MVFVLPIFGTVLAISFDVGYFSGLDINYFTMFTLAEHVVFALEIVPFIVFLIVLLPISFGIGASAFAIAEEAYFAAALGLWGCLSGRSIYFAPQGAIHKDVIASWLRLVSSS